MSGSNKTLTYDANGNLTGDGTRTFEWDAQNRLTRVLSSGTEVARFVYDGFDRRVQKIVGSTTTTFIYDGIDVLEERQGSTITTKYYRGVDIDELFGNQDSSGTASYYVADHLGSIIRVTNSAGTVTLTRQYDLWGNLESGSTTAGPAYTGRDWDPETGLYYYRARYYDPTQGRFIGEDPAGGIDGPNLYGYVGSNAANGVDPLGLWNLWNPGTWGVSSNTGENPWNPLDSSAHWDATGRGGLQGAEAFADGVVPFADPFASLGFYSKCDKALQASRRIGEWTRDIELSLAGGGLIARSRWFAGSSSFGKASTLFSRGSGLLNKGLVRVGWNYKGTRLVGRLLFRIAVGAPLRTGAQWMQRTWEWMRHFDIN